jgi:rhodanese-related sulfurtransferase
MSTATATSRPSNDTRTTILVAVVTFATLLLIGLVGWALTRPEPAPAPQASTAVAPAPHVHDFETISLDDFKRGLDAGELTVIDVRSMEAYVSSHIPGSLHIPVTRIQGEIPWIPKDKPVVTYCSCPAEESSGEAAMILANGGIRALALSGGFDAWLEKGYPTASGVQ